MTPQEMERLIKEIDALRELHSEIKDVVNRVIHLDLGVVLSLDSDWKFKSIVMDETAYRGTMVVYVGYQMINQLILWQSDPD